VSENSVGPNRVADGVKIVRAGDAEYNEKKRCQ
jgi:hypothetical protein